MTRVPSLVAALLAATSIAACADGEKAESPAPQPSQTVQAEKFPSSTGMTLQDLRGRYAEGVSLAPSVSIIRRGENRVGFALFDRAQKQVTGAEVAIYLSNPDGTGVRGPFNARSEKIGLKPQYESKQSSEDPDGVKSVYVADVDFPKRGKVIVMGLARLDGRLVSTSGFAMTVDKDGLVPPDVGDKAITIHTPTAADVGGDLAKIDTRLPPLRSLHEVDFADVVGKEPVVITFATPQLCQTRVCGPVVDLVEQVRAETEDKDIAWIHQEVYNDNEIAKGIRSQLIDWRMRTEPWTYVIGRSGTIVERFEGAFSARELEAAVKKVERQ